MDNKIATNDTLFASKTIEKQGIFCTLKRVRVTDEVTDVTPEMQIKQAFPAPA